MPLAVHCLALCAWNGKFAGASNCLPSPPSFITAPLASAGCPVGVCRDLFPGTKRHLDAAWKPPLHTHYPGNVPQTGNSEKPVWPVLSAAAVCPITMAVHRRSASVPSTCGASSKCSAGCFLALGCPTPPLRWVSSCPTPGAPLLAFVAALLLLCLQVVLRVCLLQVEPCLEREADARISRQAEREADARISRCTRAEHEADAIGLQLMARACFDPKACTTMLQKLHGQASWDAKTKPNIRSALMHKTIWMQPTNMCPVIGEQARQPRDGIAIAIAPSWPTKAAMLVYKKEKKKYKGHNGVYSNPGLLSATNCHLVTFMSNQSYQAGY
eukprot:1162083-Pelagomonas_calceolata.AAC.11